MKRGNYLNAQKGRGIEDTQRNTQNAALNVDLSFIGGVRLLVVVASVFNLCHLDFSKAYVNDFIWC